jgi:hypothetical protein
MDEVSTKSQWDEAKWRHDVDRCHREIALAEEQLRAGHPDVDGLVLALADWSQELRILERDQQASQRALIHTHSAADG